MLFKIKTILQTEGKKYTSNLCFKKMWIPSVFRFHVKGNSVNSSIVTYDHHMISSYTLLNLIVPIESLKVKTTHCYSVSNTPETLGYFQGKMLPSLQLQQARVLSVCYSLAQSWAAPHGTFFSLHVKLSFTYWYKQVKIYLLMQKQSGYLKHRGKKEI